MSIEKEYLAIEAGTTYDHETTKDLNFSKDEYSYNLLLNLTTTGYILEISENRVRVNPCPSGVNPSKLIVFFGDNFDLKDLTEALIYIEEKLD